MAEPPKKTLLEWLTENVPEYAETHVRQEWLGRLHGALVHRLQVQRDLANPEPLQTEEALALIAMSWVDGHVWTAADMPADLATLCFLPLCLMGSEMREQILEKGVVMFWADVRYDRCGMRAVNGYPFFAKMGELRVREWVRVRQIAAQYQAVKTQFQGGAK